MKSFLLSVGCLLLIACQLPPTSKPSHLSPYPIEFTQLPPEASEVVQALEQLISQAIMGLEPKITTLKKEHIAQLQKLQEKYTELGKLDEAVAIRDVVRQINNERPLRGDLLPDPGNLSSHCSTIGQVLYFDVVGSTQGTVCAPMSTQPIRGSLPWQFMGGAA